MSLYFKHTYKLDKRNPNSMICSAIKGKAPVRQHLALDVYPEDKREFCEAHQGFSVSAPLTFWERSVFACGCLAASLAFVHQMPGAAPTHVWQSRCLRTSHRQAPWRPSTPINKNPGCSIKRKEAPTQGTPWRTLKNFIPGRTPDPKTTRCMVPFIWTSLRGSSTEKGSASVGGCQCGKEGWWHCSASGHGDSCTTGSVFLTPLKSTL